jgi:hypothetical protein
MAKKTKLSYNTKLFIIIAIVLAVIIIVSGTPQVANFLAPGGKTQTAPTKIRAGSPDFVPTGISMHKQMNANGVWTGAYIYTVTVVNKGGDYKNAIPVTMFDQTNNLGMGTCQINGLTLSNGYTGICAVLYTKLSKSAKITVNPIGGIGGVAGFGNQITESNYNNNELTATPTDLDALQHT